MAENDLKDFTTNWIVAGFLMFCLLTFAITFMYNNNTSGLDDGTGDIFGQNYDNISNRLIETPEDANFLLNITANTNPEVSDLGSRDSVSAAFESKKSASANWEDSKKIIGFVFSGDTGKIILGVVGGLITFLSAFYIWRFIRAGS